MSGAHHVSAWLRIAVASIVPTLMLCLSVVAPGSAVDQGPRVTANLTSASVNAIGEPVVLDSSFTEKRSPQRPGPLLIAVICTGIVWASPRVTKDRPRLHAPGVTVGPRLVLSDRGPPLPA